MIGLRFRHRDGALPARAGAPRLVAPHAEEVQGWIVRHMLRPDAPAVESVTWEYARWKPEHSLTCAYAVLFADASEELVVTKRYVDGKARHLSARPLKERSWREISPRLWPSVVLPRETTLMFAQVADRELTGIPFLLDRRKVARLLGDVGLVGPRLVRRRHLNHELLRYKPERRAVYRLDVHLRGPERSALHVGCRVLPRAQAERIARRRRELEQEGSEARTPALLGHDLEQGILLEQWLDVQSFEPDSFDHSELAGAALARLHGRGCKAEGQASEDRVVLEEIEPLFRVDDVLRSRLFRVDLPAPGKSAWRHGDFHPDQLALDAQGEPWILDLDLLGRGDPLRDLASWIADAIVELPSASAYDLAHPLLMGYAAGGGLAVDEPRLWALVGEELLKRAAGVLRRLERDAVATSLRALQKAREVVPAGSLIE